MLQKTIITTSYLYQFIFKLYSTDKGKADIDSGQQYRIYQLL